MKYHGINAPFIPEDDKARFYLNLSEANGDQVELVAKEQDELRDNGIPPMMTRELDNKYTTTTPNPDAGIARVINEKPYTAAYFQGDQMNLWNKVAKEMRPLLPYDPKAEYSNGIDFEARRKAAADEKKRILAEADETAKQNAVMRDMMARFGDWRNRDDATLRYWLNTSGKATGIDTSGWDVEDFRKRGGLGNVEWEKAVDVFGWQETQDAYRMLFHPEYRPQNLVDLDENAPAYLLLARKQMLEDENKMLRGNEWTVDVLNSVLQSVPLMTEMALTGGESAAVRNFMEMGYKEAYRQGGVKLVSKMLAQGLGGAMKNGLKRLPFYAPKAAAAAYTDNYLGGFATMPDGEGGVSIEVNDVNSRDFFEGFISHLIQSYTEVASEELGGLVPFGDVDATILGRLVPKRLRNAFVSKIAWNPRTRRAFGKHILGNLPFHGFIGEFAEEELGNVMSFMATELMQLLGAKEENTPQTESLLMGGRETGETAASIMLQTLLFRGMAGAVNTWRPGGAAYALKNVSRVKREDKQFDAAATTVGQSRLGQASVPEAKAVIDGIRGGDDSIAVDPEDAENILLQATEGKTDEEADGARETLAQAGITPETIAEARKNGTDVILSANTLLALAGNKKFKNAWELVHKIRENMVSEVFGKTTKEITADSFTKEQLDEMTDRAKRNQDFLRDVQKIMSQAVNTAMKNARDKGLKIGVSQQNIRDYLSIYPWFANYLAENVETEEGLKKLKEMVQNLSVEFAENPEKFDTTEALNQGVIGIPGFYSNMMKAIEDAPQQKMTPAQWTAYLQKSGGMKAGETSWRGSVEEFFKGRDPKTAIDKQELIDAFQDGLVDILEIEGGASSTFYSDRLAEIRKTRETYIRSIKARVINELNESPLQEALFHIQTELDEANKLDWKERSVKRTAARAKEARLDEALNRVFYYNTTPRFIAEHGPSRAVARVRAGLSYWTEDKVNAVAKLSDDEFMAWISECDDAMSDAEDRIPGEPGDAAFMKLLSDEYDMQARFKESMVSNSSIQGSDIRNSYTTKGLSDVREVVIYSPEVDTWADEDSIHFGTATRGTALLWVRFGETTDEDGKRVLVIDEIQSNRHQQGREKGYRGHRKPDGAFGAVQNASVDAVRDDILNGGRVIWIDVFDANNLSRSARFLVRDGVIENYEAHDYAEHPDLEALVGMGVREAFGEKVADWYAEIDKIAKSAETEQDAADSLGRSHVVVADDVRADWDAIPAAPFEKNWQELGMKRMIRYAAENGYDKIAWTSGEQQAKRYNIANVINGIERTASRTLSVDGKSVALDGYASVEDIEELGFGEVEAGFLFDVMINRKYNGARSVADAIKLTLAERENDADIEALREFAKGIKVKGEGRTFRVRTERHPFSFMVASDGTIENSTLDGIEGKTVHEVFGKELGTQILDIADDKTDNDVIELDKDVVIGGEGMKTFYDKILRNFTDKYIKKWGSKVGVVELPNVEEAGREMWGFDVTDKMKEDVMTKGQPLFQLGGLRGALNMPNARELYDNYLRAVEMDRTKEKSPQKIWIETGWAKGKDGKWRMELPDAEVKMPKNFLKGKTMDAHELLRILFPHSMFIDGKWENAPKLTGLIADPALFKAYPKLKEFVIPHVFEVNSTAGGYLPGSTQIRINTYNMESYRELGRRSNNLSEPLSVEDRKAIFEIYKKEMRANLSHEINHAIQEWEGFGQGASAQQQMEFLKKQAEYDKEVTKGGQEINDAWYSWIDTLPPEQRKKYRTSTSYVDAMARNAQWDRGRLAIDSMWLKDRMDKEDVPENIKSKVNGIVDRILKVYLDAGSFESGNALAVYIRSTGEVDSRNVEYRLGLTDEERKKSPPVDTELLMEAPVSRDYQVLIHDAKIEHDADVAIAKAIKKMEAKEAAAKAAAEAKAAKEKAEAEAEAARKAAEEAAAKARAEAEAKAKAEAEAKARAAEEARAKAEAEAKAKAEAEAKAKAEEEAARKAAEKAIKTAETANASRPGTTVKGQINLARFKQSQEAIITLFKDADASTLPHESAHWLKAAMESLVGAGFATEKMKEDLATIDAWLDKQDYSEAKTDQDKYRAREEYFARAFEQYLREGHFPEAATNGLKSALRRLARMLQSIYRNALALNAPIDDSIRGFFDDIFAVEEVVDGTSVLSGILREINTGALALSKEDLKKLETAVAGAKEDAETEAWLAALQDYQQGLKDQQKLWRNEAKEAYEASKAEQAYTYVRNGHKLDENFLRNVLKLDEETISILKKKRLTYKAKAVETAPEATPEAQETPVAAEPAVETAPTETTAPEPIVLSGLVPETRAAKEAWAEIDRNTPVVIQDADTLAAILDTIIESGEFHGEKLNDAYTQLTKTYKNGSGGYYKADRNGKLRTKAHFESLVKRVLHNENVEDFVEMYETDSLQAPLPNGKGKGDGKAQSLEDVTADTNSSADAFSGEGFETKLRAINDYIATLKKDSFKREVAKLLLEFSMEYGNKFPTDWLLDAYKERHEGGGVRSDTTFYDTVKKIRAELKKFMARDVYQQTVETDVPSDILATMAELGYGDVNTLITDLKTALGRSAFIKDYMNRKHAEYREAFLDNPNWASEAGATRYLDAILRALKVTEGMKFSERVKIARREAAREVVQDHTLREVLRTEVAVRKSLKSNAATILKAIKSGKEDKAAAITAALDMCRNEARLEVAKRLRGEVDHLVNVAKRAGRGKPGNSVNGDALNIVRAVLWHFGISNRRPEWTTGPNDPQNVTEGFRVMAEFVAQTKGITDPEAMDAYVQAERNRWSPWLWDELTGANARATARETAERRLNDAGFTRELFGDDYYFSLLRDQTEAELERAGEARTALLDLSLEQLRELSDFAAWVNGTGRNSVKADKKSFAAKLNASLEVIIPSLEKNATGAFKDNADKTTLEKLASTARSGLHSNKNLLWLAHLFDGRSEFYGEHIMGPMRRLFQLPLSMGASKEMFWYDRISAAVKPHEVALMKSCQDRKLTFAVNNEVTQRRGYEQVYGKQCAFILLNAGTVEGRQRLMDGFGWTADELKANLSKFTKEDFEHAEAIWKSLKELGTEVAKTFYKERHYRMTWADLAKIEVTLEDGTHILSDGGYFPIAYKYHDSSRGYDTDLMNPFVKMPNRQGRPGATNTRVREVHRQALLLDPSVLERHIKENAHYVGMWEPLSMANAIWSNPDFKDNAIHYFGPEVYKVLRDCMNYINNPFQNTGKGRQLANWLGASFATIALGYKATTIEKQYVSLLLGVDRLVNRIKKEGGGEEIEGYFNDAWNFSFTGFDDAPGIRGFRRRIADMSPFLRSRFNNIDRDLTVIDTEFKGKVGKATDRFRSIGFLGLKLCDLHVAGVQWYAAYTWALNSKQKFSEEEARAFADDFVASTQGGARTIDMPAIQLSDLGKAVTPFFGPACAAFNTRLAGLAAFKEMTAGERVAFAVDNFILPVVALGLISAIQSGIFKAAIGGDDDDWDRVRRRSFIAMLSEPVSGIAVIQDVADAVVRAAVNGKPIQGEVLEVGAFRPFNDVIRDAYSAIRNWDNPDYALYLGVSAAGEAMGLPVVQVYEDYEKMILWNFGDEDSKPIKKQLQGDKKK